MTKTKTQLAQEYAENVINAFGNNGVPCGIKDIKQMIYAGYVSGYTACEQSMWRSVEEELPEEKKVVLCFMPDMKDNYAENDSYFDIAILLEGEFINLDCETIHPTHWMQIPLPPPTPRHKHREEMKLRVFEAFAGYGSQSIALELLAQSCPDFQFETVGISEIDKYAIKAYSALHGENIPNYGDITKIDWSQTADFDLFTYSFPCQDISSAGKQRGFSEGSGTRSSCLWACAKAIEKKRPKFLLMENVKALTQKKFSADFCRWREWLIKQGYTNYYTVLNAKDYGVPQNRERVFMVSFRGEHTPYTFPRPFELVRRLKHVLEDDVDEKYWLKQEQIQALIKHNERKQSEGCGFKTNFQTGEGISGAIKTKEGSREYDTYVKVPTYGNSRLNAMIADGKIDPEETLWIDCYNQRVDPDIAGTILARVNATGHYLVSDPRGCAMRGRPDASGQNFQQIELGSDVANAITSVQKDSMAAEPRVIQVGNLIRESNYKNPHRGRIYSTEGIAPCLSCCEGGNLEPKILQRDHGYAQGGVLDIAPALTASKWQDNNFSIAGFLIRKLTPRECFRLMDVPENYIDRLLAAGISNTQLYKLAGNSIVVACLYHIFRKMFCETAKEIGAPIAHSRETPIIQQLTLL